MDQKQIDRLIFGKDNTQGIVNITVTKEKTARVYRETKDGVYVDEYDYTPYVLTANRRDNSQKLKGRGYYQWLTPLDDSMNYEELYDRDVYKPRSKEEGFMLISGMTYFKGMKIEDVSLLSFDIEATSFDPLTDKARVVLISNTFRKNGIITRKLFKARTKNEECQMLKDWCAWVRKMDPSILIGHNVFGYDLMYLNGRASVYNMGLDIGRDGSSIAFDKKTSKKRKDGSQSYDYHNATVDGREIVDSMFMAITYDSGRKFPSYALKRIEKHLNLVDSSRTEWNFEKNNVESTCLDENLWVSFCKYCEEDSDSPIKMFDIMAPSLFYMNNSVPKKFQQMINEATGSQIDSFMVRAYLQDGFSQPKTSNKSDFEGAISMGIPGVYEHVRKVDVASLYPSIMRQYKIYPKDKDPEQYFLKSLDYFTEQRLADKKKAKETGEKYYDDLQNSRKILINSMYGFMGASYLLYNYPAGASSVTRYGREILQKGVEWACGFRLKHSIKKIKNKGKDNEENQMEWLPGDKTTDGLGYTLVNVDTDSFSYTNGKAPTKEEYAKEIEGLNSLYPDLIHWEDDGIYDKVIVVKAKNYILKQGTKIKFKGSSLLDQKKEPALTEFLQGLINLLLTDKNNNKCIDLYNTYCKEARSIKDINRWATKKTVTKAVYNSERLNERKVLNAIAKEQVQEGDKVWLYTAIDPSDDKNNILKLTKNYSNDSDHWHYVKRVYDTATILENVLDMNEFIKYHNKKNQSLLGVD